MIGHFRTAVAAALLLAAGNSWALGLGQIQVKSKLNQPLVAEIPIISTTPGELAALKARLASPDTFRRVGLQPPTGAAADLQFSLGSDAKGRPIIRVTTLRPVDQPMVDFLIEVDWGNGRLVREYTALVGTPNTASAPAQAAVQMAQTAEPNQVQRPVAPAAAQPQAPDITIAPLPDSEPERASTAVAPTAPAQPVSVAKAAPPPANPVVVAQAQSHRVQPGESLSKIASGLEIRKAFSLDQTMLALLQANPDAFTDGNINRLRSGSVLRVPAHDAVASINAEEAGQLVRQQARQWVEQRRAVSQPAKDVAKPASPAPASQTAAAAKPAKAAVAQEAKVATQAQTQGARLQIVPPSAPGKATGMKSGTAAGSEGSMLQQQLQQRDEDIAAKAAEIGELKERVAALEKLKSEQQQLISLKDTELAAAQQRLANANQLAAQAKTAAPAATTAQPQPAQAAKNQTLPYVWGGIGVVVLALLAWLLTGRKPTKKPQRRSVFDSEALAASMKVVEPAAPTEPAADNNAPPSFAQALEEAAPVDVELEQPLQQPTPAAEQPAVAEQAAVTIDLADVPATPSRVTLPDWNSGWMKQDVTRTGTGIVSAPEVTSESVPEAAPEVTPAVTAEAELEAPAPTTLEEASALMQDADSLAQASPEQRFKLARAFLDMGDEFSAQQILLELLDHEDTAVGDEAASMLSKLVG